MPLSAEALACIQHAQMIRVVLCSDGSDSDTVISVPCSILLHSDIAREKAITSNGYCEEIAFPPEEQIVMSDFTNFVHFLYTGTVEIQGPVSRSKFPEEEELSDRITTWDNSFCVGHRLRANRFMNHCLGLAMNLHSNIPIGYGLPVGSEVLYHILPLLEQRKHDNMYEFLVDCIAREWKDAVQEGNQERIAEWNYTFKDWPEFAGNVESLCRRG